MTEITYSVPAMHCAHCDEAVSAEVTKVDGVESVEVDLETKQVKVRGRAVDRAAVRAAIGEAGFEVA